MSKEIVPNTEILEGIEAEENPMIDKVMLAATAPDKNIPGRLDIEWSDWLMKQFDKSELVVKDKQRFPRVHGLRRLAQKLVGEIVESTTICASPPKCLANGGVDLTSFIYKVTFKKHDSEVLVTYSDAADVYYFSEKSCNSDAKFARFPSALATTRAEARALRKALGLTTCSAEELAPDLAPNTSIVEKKERVVDVDEEVPSLIDAGQIHFIKTKCAAVDIHPWKFLNSGTQKYKVLKDIPFIEAQKFCKILGDMLRSKNNKDAYVAEYAATNNVDLGKFSSTWDSEI
jgi:hypothetical protein